MISNGPVQALAGTAPHLVAILQFDSMADVNAALASPEGQAAAADLPNFASGGASLLIYDDKRCEILVSYAFLRFRSRSALRISRRRPASS